MDNTILIVDGDKRFNGLLEDIFITEGYDVISAYDGEEAISVLESNPEIPLVILDVMLPELDGWQVLSYVKERFDTKVIVLTALSDEYSEVKGLRSGADDYMIKPFKRAVLVERARRLIVGFAKQSSSKIVCEGLKILQNEKSAHRRRRN